MIIMSNILVISNNPMTKEKIEGKMSLDFIDGDVYEVFKASRDYIHKGHTLLTHPLMSSVKPNETPYRTILVSKDKKPQIDFESLGIMEDSIESLEKFLNMFKCPNWDKRVREDFMLIDYDLINNVINK